MTTPIDNSTSAPLAGSGAMFDGIARRYDLLNRLISLGVDQGWRRKTVASLELPASGRCLDLATGTADLAVLIARTHPGCHVVGIDPSTKMMDVGRQKLGAARLSSRVELQEGDAQQLELGDAQFDGVSMAFGIRNVPDRAKALSEMVRVTRPGGRIAILELSEPRSGVMRSIARWHMHSVVPWLGGLLSGSREYSYLPQSIAAFPPPQTFVGMMEHAGMQNVSARSLTFGVCHLYVGTVVSRPGAAA
jgi:demethylmenaquinone methyltransferase/2-methoxy-6-polyprenyl-1,4-benzoquinol methylase